MSSLLLRGRLTSAEVGSTRRGRHPTRELRRKIGGQAPQSPDAVGNDRDWNALGMEAFNRLFGRDARLGTSVVQRDETIGWCGSAMKSVS
jgi:hypothetical protein